MLVNCEQKIMTLTENHSNLSITENLHSFESSSNYKFGLCFGYKENYKNFRIKIIDCQWDNNKIC